MDINGILAAIGEANEDDLAAIDQRIVTTNAQLDSLKSLRNVIAKSVTAATPAVALPVRPKPTAATTAGSSELWERATAILRETGPIGLKDLAGRLGVDPRGMGRLSRDARFSVKGPSGSKVVSLAEAKQEFDAAKLIDAATHIARLVDAQGIGSASDIARKLAANYVIELTDEEVIEAAERSNRLVLLDGNRITVAR